MACTNTDYGRPKGSMAASNNHYPAFDEEHTADEGRICYHCSTGFHPAGVQCELYYEDGAVIDGTGERSPSSLYNGAMNMELVGTAVGLTYNVLDRLQEESVQGNETQAELRRSLDEYIDRNQTDMHEADPTGSVQEQHSYAEEYELTNPMLDDLQNMVEDWNPPLYDMPSSEYSLFADHFAAGPTLDPPVVLPSETQSAVLTCPHCGPTKCKNLKSLERHIARHDAPTYLCDYAENPCSFRSQKRTDVRRHVNTVHLNKRELRCSHCGKLDSRKDNHKRHVQICERTLGYSSPTFYQTHGPIS